MAALSPSESTYTYSPSDAVAGRASHVDDVRAGRLPWHGGLGEVLPGTIGLRVVHFPPMCLTARISLRRPTSHITPRTGPTRFDVRSSPGGRAEWALGEHPHVPRGRVAAWLGAGDGLGSFLCFWSVIPPPRLGQHDAPAPRGEHAMGTTSPARGPAPRSECCGERLGTLRPRPAPRPPYRLSRGTRAHV